MANSNVANQEQNASQADLIVSPQATPHSQDSPTVSQPVSTSATRAEPEKESTFQRVMGPVLIFETAVLFLLNQYTYKISLSLYPSSIHEMLLLKGLNSIIVGSIGLGITRQSPVVLVGMDALYVGTYAGLIVANNLFYFMSIAGLPVALSSAVQCTLPALVGLLALIFLGERMNLINIIATVVCIVGLTMVLKQPAALYGAATKTDSLFLLYIGYTLIGSLAFAFSGIINRKIGRQVNCFINIFYIGIFMALLESYILYPPDFLFSFLVVFTPL